MSVYKLIFTNIGLSKIQNAELNGNYVDIEKFAVGDGVINTLVPSMTGLLNEKYRNFINQISTNDGKTNFDLIVPSEVGGFHIREVALYDIDDDCICIGTVPDTYKVNPDDGATKAVHIRVSTATANVDNLQLSYDNSQVYATYLYANNHQNNKANPHEVTKAQVGLGNADNTADNAKNVLSATKLTTARTITLTGDVDGNTSFDGSANVSINVSLDIDGATDIGTNLADTDLIMVDNGANGTNRKSAISRIWTYISGKLTGAISTVLTTNLTASRALVSDASGKISVSSITSTILGYLSNVTSDVQTQINGKAATNQTLYIGTTAVTINRTTGAITLTGTSIDGNSGTATKLQTARTISLAGDVTGSVSFDGSANASITTAVGDDSHNHSISTVTGLQTALDSKQANLVSGTNIKTVNGNSLVGSGNIPIDLLAYDAAHSFTGNGYQKLSNGLILQWMTVNDTTADGYKTFTFPIAFPNQCLFSFSREYGGSGNASIYRELSVTTTQITVVRDFYTGSFSNFLGHKVLVIGY